MPSQTKNLGSTLYHVTPAKLQLDDLFLQCLLLTFLLASNPTPFSDQRIRELYEEGEGGGRKREREDLMEQNGFDVYY